MTVPGEEVVRSTRWGGRRRRSDGTKAATIFFIWVILIFSQLSLVLSLHEETGQYNSLPPRKARFFNSESSTFHAPPSSSSGSGSGKLVDREAETPSSIYEDDKRIIHTGPNPLHN